MTENEADARHKAEPETTVEKIIRTFNSNRDLVVAKNIDYGDSAFEKPMLCPELDSATAIRV